MGLRTYDYLCEPCDEVTMLLVEFDKRDDPVMCSKCGTALLRLPPAPMVMNRSWPDGLHKRAAEKEEARLALAQVNARGKEDKTRIQAERNKIKEGK